MTTGRIHSIESMGLVDGPGIRTVVFFQGCKLRCQYCHNPDTWEFGIGDVFTPKELVEKIARFKPYFKDNGGVTFSGGEPLMQPEFLLEVLKGCQEAGIHTCIDTAGCGCGSYEEILKYTDLVLLDLKEITPKAYQNITGQSMDDVNTFLAQAQAAKTNLWIRHVVVPGLTDSEEHMAKLRDYVNQLSYVQRVELLPYHLLGTNKYDVMKIPYPLEGVNAMDKETTLQLQNHYFGGIKSC